MEWFIKAHEAGASNAANLVGRLLAAPLNDHLEAVKWLRLAEEQGDESACVSLALIYEDRGSPAHDARLAFEYWKRLAEQSKGERKSTAMFSLVHCYRNGTGTDRNRDEAIRWLDRIMKLSPKDRSDYRVAAKLRKEIDEEFF